MAKALHILSSIRHDTHIRKTLNSQIRKCSIEVRDQNDSSRKFNLNQNHEVVDSQDVKEIAKDICKIIRGKPKWEQTLLDKYPSFNFHNPLFILELFNQQKNALLSFRFFLWLSSHHEFSLDSMCFSALFDALVEAKACNAAKYLLDYSGFNPEASSLECYIQCLCESGFVDKAVNIFFKLKETGFSPSISTWNLALKHCLKIERTDLIWKLYQEMIEPGFQVDINVETSEYLIQAFCRDKNISKAYDLLHQVLEDGIAINSLTFNKLISGFYEQRNYDKVSELLHIMIARNRAPDNFTFQEVINGLCKNKRQLEGFRVFNDLKHQRYSPDMVMYTTMIHGLCKIGWLGEARKQWFEMIEKGYLPNEYTYNSFIHGCCGIGNFEEAMRLNKEMRDRGYKESTVSFNIMISGFCLHGRADDALDLLKEMRYKGIASDVLTYNILIRGFCKEGKILLATNLFKELFDMGLKPTTSSFFPLIKSLCQVGNVQEAKKLWKDMQNLGLKPMVGSYDHMINGLCGEGCITEAMEWIVTMTENMLKPKVQTCERLLQCLLQTNKLDDCLRIVDLMLKTGYNLRKGILCSLINKFCENDKKVVKTQLEILENVNPV